VTAPRFGDRRHLLVVAGLVLVGCSGGPSPAQTAVGSSGKESPTLAAAHSSSEITLTEVHVGSGQAKLDAGELKPPPPPPPPPHDPNIPDPDKRPPEKAQTENLAGRISAESVEATVGGSRDAFGRCTRDYATFSARVLVGASGSVMDASILESSPDDARMRDCVVSALRNLKFASTGDAAVPLSFRLAINPSSAMR
jgi:outer membrane biosynthesis protein TonB